MMGDKDTFAVMNIERKGELIELLAEKAIFWERKKLLFLSDLHLGKSTHFMKNGIPMPSETALIDLTRLVQLIEAKQPQTVLFLGDLFHSVFNAEFLRFGEAIAPFLGHIDFLLVVGNHDILPLKQFESIGLKVVGAKYTLAPFTFSHEPLLTLDKEDLYNFCGHIHPGFRLSCKGKQRMSLPCFYCDSKQMILTAFSELAGKMVLQAKKAAEVFVITQQQVLNVPLG